MLVAGAAFLFPIPLAALSGIALPLPDSVSRIAADVAHATGTVLPGLGGGEERRPERVAPDPALPRPETVTAAAVTVRDAPAAPPRPPAKASRRPAPIAPPSAAATTPAPRPGNSRTTRPVVPGKPAPPPTGVVVPTAPATPAVSAPAAAARPPTPVTQPPAPVPPPPSPVPPPTVQVPPLPVDVPPLPPLGDLPAPADEVVPPVPVPAPVICVDGLVSCPPSGSGG